MNFLQNIPITSIDEAFIVASPKGRQLQIKNRPFYGLSFCESGKITYVHNGHQITSDPDHVVFFPMGASYSLYCEESGNFPLINFYCAPEFEMKEFMTFRLHSPKSYLNEFERLREFLLFEKHARAMGVMYDICGGIAEEDSDDRNLLGTALDYLEQHYDDPSLCNSILAEKIGISEVYFRRIFHKTLGVSPKQYILDIRVRRAKQLLSNGHSSVTEIAEACGFSSVYHFCRCFKKITDMTPTDFRNFSMHHEL